jgi:hypothetical protein
MTCTYKVFPCQCRGSFHQQVISKVVYQVLGMETTFLRVEDILDGASNFLSWKARVIFALKEYDISKLVEKVVTPPTDPTALEAQTKKEIKAEGVLLDLVKNHLIPHLSERKMTKEMFDALVSLYQSKNMNRKMVLRNKLRSM